MDTATATISENERRLLTAHYAFYRALDSGDRIPTTSAQWHFVAVCRGTALAQTEHERAYSQFKRVIAAAGISEAAVVAARFVLPPEMFGEHTNLGGAAGFPVRPCAGCGRPIPPERLQAIPDAIRCVACQQRTESCMSGAHTSELECPRCSRHGIKSPMVWRMARDPARFSGYFLGCSRFPACRYIDRS